MANNFPCWTATGPEGSSMEHNISTFESFSTTIGALMKTAGNVPSIPLIVKSSSKLSICLPNAFLLSFSSSGRLCRTYKYAAILFQIHQHYLIAAYLYVRHSLPEELKHLYANLHQPLCANF